MSDIFLSVVVPCYNEKENLEAGVLQEMHAYLTQQEYSFEVIISDDGSTDASREIAGRQIASMPGFRLLANPHGGKPSALWFGTQAAQGTLILYTDMDQSTPISELGRLLLPFQQGYDIVIGSRGLERPDFPFHRKLGSRIFREFRRLFLLRSISDTQCGFKAMRSEIARELFPKLEPIRCPVQITGWRVTAFDVELLFLAERSGYRIAELTVEWSNRDIAQGKGKGYLGESLEMAQQMLRVKLNEIRGVYDS